MHSRLLSMKPLYNSGIYKEGLSDYEYKEKHRKIHEA